MDGGVRAAWQPGKKRLEDLACDTERLLGFLDGRFVQIARIAKSPRVLCQGSCSAQQCLECGVEGSSRAKIVARLHEPRANLCNPLGVMWHGGAGPLG